MVSIKSILVIAFTAASVGSVQAFNAPEYRRIKLSGDNHYGNFTIYSGTGTAVSHTARPTLFSKHEHKYVTVTYTLGDGRAITKTITKTREFQHETPIPAPVWYVNPVITTVQVVDPLVTRVIKSAKKKGRKTSTTYTTVTRDPPCPGTIIEYPKPTHSYVPKELVHDVTNDPVFEHPEFAPKHPKFAPKHTAVTGITTATRFKVVSTTHSTVAHPTVKPIHMPPYGNFTINTRTGDDEKTTTTYVFVTLTTSIAGPTGTATPDI